MAPIDTTMLCLPRDLQVKIVAMAGRDVRLAYGIAPGKLRPMPFLEGYFTWDNWNTDGEDVWLVLQAPEGPSYILSNFSENETEFRFSVLCISNAGKCRGWEYNQITNLWQPA